MPSYHLTIPDGVEATSGVSLSLYPLTTMVTNYLAPMFTGASLTRWTEDSQSSLVGSVENLTRNCMLYSSLRHYMTCPRDRTSQFPLSDSILYQPVLCGCTRSTYWALLPSSYFTRLRR